MIVFYFVENLIGKVFGSLVLISLKVPFFERSTEIHTFKLFQT